MKTQIGLKKDGDQLTIQLSGEITDETQLPQVQPEKNQNIVVNLEGVKYVNSGGVRVWINWINTTMNSVGGAPITFEMMPPIVVKQAAQFRDFLPKNATVISFVVPYFCPNCQATTELTYKKGGNLNSAWTQKEFIKNMSVTKCPKCGEPAEIDAVPEDYALLR